MPLSWLDIFLVAVMFISGLLAMLRGLTREVLSIMAWALAAVSTYYVWPQYKDEVRQYVEPQILADVALATGIFIIVLIVVSLITVRVADRVLDSSVGALDRTLGFIFGLGRGLILVVILYLFYSWLVPKEDQPQWIKEARSLPIIEQTGDMIVSLLPENPGDIIPNKSRDESSLPAKQKTTASSRASAKTRQDYGSGERRGLNQLMESSQFQRN
ncbi:colicin V production protein [bacterium MnTg02]|nr:colicin V production protein [bacterium MnTg02]